MARQTQIPYKGGNYKTRQEIHAMQNKKAIQRINESKRWFTEIINKIDKPLDNHIKKEKNKDWKPCIEESEE